MGDVNKAIEETEKDMKYFEVMVKSSEKLITPYKNIIIWLIIALIISNIIWGGVHFYHLKKAYEEPATYEYQYEQNQDLNNQNQNQNAGGKGAN